jgi:predicted FMN-binding regulatory protein PaiB
MTSPGAISARHEISLERLDGKAKLFQNRSPEDRIRFYPSSLNG